MSLSALAEVHKLLKFSVAFCVFKPLRCLHSHSGLIWDLALWFPQPLSRPDQSILHYCSDQLDPGWWIINAVLMRNRVVRGKRGSNVLHMGPRWGLSREWPLWQYAKKRSSGSARSHLSCFALVSDVKVFWKFTLKWMWRAAWMRNLRNEFILRWNFWWRLWCVGNFSIYSFRETIEILKISCVAFLS